MFDIKEIDKHEYIKLLNSWNENNLKNTYEKGLYYFVGVKTKKYMGINNMSNEAFTKIFDTYEECKNWLERG